MFHYTCYPRHDLLAFSDVLPGSRKSYHWWQVGISLLLVVPTPPSTETMKGADEQMRWNILWRLLQNRAGRTGLAPALWYGRALLTLALVYLGTGRLGLSLGAVSGFATLVWLPSGLSVAALFLGGSR